VLLRLLLVLVLRCCRGRLGGDAGQGSWALSHLASSVALLRVLLRLLSGLPRRGG
jgi:hypothetical protein